MRKTTIALRSLLVGLCLASLAATEPVFIKPGEVDWASIGAPPAAGSDEEKQEIAKLLEWQEKRTASEVERCKAEEEVTPFIFSDVLGDKFTQKSLPVTATLLKQVQGDIKGLTKAVKERWERKRPPVTDSRIKCCVAIEATGSYPSAHAVRGVVWSKILAELFPEKKDALLKRGLLMGEDRVIAGIHFPSDVAAGQKIGDMIFDKLMANPSFKATLKDAKAECETAGVTK